MNRNLRCAVALALFLAPSPSLAAAPSTAIVVALPNGLQASAGPQMVRVSAVTDSILRVRIAHDGKFAEDASWAVPANVRRQSVNVQSVAGGFRTGALMVHLDAATLRLTVTDLQGRRILADAPEPLRFDGPRFTLRKALPLGEHIYGMGDKTGNFDRRGESFVNWNTDAWGFQRDTDPIYKSIPFYIATGGEAALTACSSTIVHAAGSILGIATPIWSSSAPTEVPSTIISSADRQSATW